MNLTLGSGLFYGGLLAFAVLLVTFIIVKAVHASKTKKLKARFDEEYGSAAENGGN